MPTNPSSLARVNGIELSYQVTGEGEPLILLHGGFGSSRCSAPTWGSSLLGDGSSGSTFSRMGARRPLIGRCASTPVRRVGDGTHAPRW